LIKLINQSTTHPPIDVQINQALYRHCAGDGFLVILVHMDEGGYPLVPAYDPDHPASYDCSVAVIYCDQING